MATSRAGVFRDIKAALNGDSAYVSEKVLLAAGDSLELLRKLPDHCVSLVLTDPPYHSTKKANIYGDTHFEEDAEYVAWMSLYAEQWKRVLKPNGSLFCFCASEMAARLEVLFAKNFNILAHVVWTKPNEPGYDGWKGKMKKEALRQWYPHSERILFAEPSAEGNLHRSTFANYLRAQRTASGLTAKDLAEMTGAYGKVNHGGAVSNWETGRNIPSREQYRKLCDAILSTKKVKSMLAYEDAVRPFNVDASVEFTDVWSFASVRPFEGKHPAEKPIDLIEHCIRSTTFEGDIVLDCFAGSGSTAVGALRLKRRCVAFEIEAKWIRSAKRLLSGLTEGEKISHSYNPPAPLRKRVRENQPQIPLFGATD